MNLYTISGNRSRLGFKCKFSIFNFQFSIAPVRAQSLQPARNCSQRRAYLLTEALVYIGLVFVLLGVAYVAMYKFIDKSVVLRRNAEDISRAMHAGERWRADVRSAALDIRVVTNAANPILQLATAHGQVSYATSERVVLRRVGEGPWVALLKDVKASSMQPDIRAHITGWRWELELEPRTKGAIKPGRVRPLFTFLSVPQTGSTP